MTNSRLSVPSVSGDQQRFMASDLRRAMTGQKTRTGMNIRQLRDFAHKVPGAPERKNPPSHYGSRPVTERT